MYDDELVLLESLYKKVIINEISSKFVDEVKNAVKEQELPFNNIFGNKLRLVIPVKGTKTYQEILDAVSKTPNYYGFDPQKKEVIKKIKLDPKYGGGEKEQRINLGKAISSLRDISEEEKKKYLNWFAGYNSNIPEMDNLKKYSIIISRSPIDILRMSDIGAIDSCHAEGGAYFHCAIQEAKKGGPIAYIVKTKDIENLTEEEFQNEEIFEDSSRNVQGVTALARLRIRKYLDIDTENEIAIPELKIYGTRIEGFYDTVKDFFKEKQPDLDEDNLIRSFQNKRLVKTGGTYGDSGDSAIFNRMFNTDVLYGSLGHRGEDENEESENGNEARYDQFEEELRGFNDAYGDSLVHFNAGYDVQQYDDGDDVYYNAWGGTKFEFDENIEFTDDFYDIEINDYYDLNSIKRYNPNGEYQWHKTLPYGFKDKEELAFKIQKLFKNFDNYITTRNFVDNISRITVDNAGDIAIEIGFGDDNNGSSNDTDDYRYFLQNLGDYDDDYEEIQKGILKSLYASGFIKISNEDENIKKIEAENDEEFAQTLKKFEYDNSTDTYDMYGVELLSLSDDSFGNYDLDKKKSLEKDFSAFLEKFIQNYFKPEQKENKNQLSFKEFFESYETPILKQYGISFSLNMGTEPDYNTNNILTANLSIKINFLDNKTAHLLKFLDDNAEDLINALKLLGLRLFNISNDYQKNLERVYGKFLG